MLLISGASLLLAQQALAGVIDLTIPSTSDIIAEVDKLLHPNSAISAEYGYSEKVGKKVDICTLQSNGDGQDDTDNIEEIFKMCSTDSVIKLPDERYHISRPLQLSLTNSYLDLHGYLTYSTDVPAWISTHIPFAFQNQSIGMTISGSNFTLDGNGKGGIDGNGQVWYNYAKEIGNVYGRPMSLGIVDADGVVMKDWRTIQPQFWALVTINVTNALITDYYVNATSYNPASNVDPKNWLQNTDGIDTYRSHNITIQNMIYQGGDDCIAFKPNSTSITARNISCYGGTGIAFGSIAQYKGVTDIIQDVELDDVRLYPSNQCPGYQGIYFKSWVGESYGKPPNGGGGGLGWCRDVRIKDVYMKDIWHPIAVDTDLTYLLDKKGDQTNNGKFEWSDIHFTNVTGNGMANRLVWIDCSKTSPCFNFTFDQLDLKPGKKDHPEITYTCNNIVLGGNDGLESCHPSNSTLEKDTGGTM